MPLRPLFPRNTLGALVSILMLLPGVVWNAVAQDESEGPTETEVRAQIVDTLTAEEGSDAQYEKIAALADTGSPLVAEVIEAWRQDSLFLEPQPDGTALPVIKREGVYHRLDTGAVLPSITQDKPLGHTMKLRRALRATADLLSLADPNPDVRSASIMKLGQSQNASNLAPLQARLTKEKNPKVQKSLHLAIAFIQLKGDDSETRVKALKLLADANLMSAQDIFAKLESDADPAVAAAAKDATIALANYKRLVGFFSSLFFGLSTGSVLLVAALGLAITFGLMGVINMAHGELMVVGAYTTFIVQSFFGGGYVMPMFGMDVPVHGMKLTGGGYDAYFLVSLPFAFLVAALVGIALERGIIQFLYKRPLESLLATWGMSMVMQQSFRLMFGSQNVPMSAPSWLSGSWIINDVNMGWNRMFFIGFAIVIVLLTYLLLTKTPLGLLIRAVMQNREMASCMGVKTEHVNMLTFGFGSGLAGLAGALLSQLGNVGPGLGQDYIVDCFMTVVVGGVGNLVGTVVAALGIGMTDQMLQPVLGPIVGKITVLFAIILFLQWKPGGFFPTRSRSLEG